MLALVNPVEQARVLGTLALSHRLDILGPVGIFGLDHIGAVGLPALLIATLVAAASLPLAFGYARFRKLVIS